MDNTEKDKQELRAIFSLVFENTEPRVEATLEPNEYYVYTGVWSMTVGQLFQIASKVSLHAVSVDGYELMFTVEL